jgi:hypothetical protein
LAKVYKDINGNILNHGDEVYTIELNGKAVGGNLVKAYFKIDDSGSGYLAHNMEDRWRYSFYKKKF